MRQHRRRLFAGVFHFMAKTTSAASEWRNDRALAHQQALESSDLTG
jgi:hypothetical protein